jgi:8-oxo-dGTP diphosphatase
MVTDILAAVWRRIPKSVRRWTMRVSHPRFAATAGAIILDDSERVLLLKHVFRPGSGWGLPGGFLQAGEQPETALQRELLEEVGLNVSDLELFTVRVFKRPAQIEVLFRGRAAGNGSPQSLEVSRMGWFHLNDLPDGLPKDQRELIRQALEVD